MYSVIKSGINNFKLTSVPLIPVIAVLIARVVTDFLYDKFGHNPDSFGGSNMEFILSSVVWFALIFISMPDLS